MLCVGTTGRLDESDDQQLFVDRPNSVYIYRGFCALFDVMSYIIDNSTSASSYGLPPELTEVENEGASNAGNDSGQVLPSKLASAGRHISGIVSPTFRLEIMEDVFSLLFSRSEHLRDTEDSPDRQSCDSGPETGDKDVDDLREQEFTFESTAVDAASVSDMTTSTREILSTEVPQVVGLTVESRCFPMEASSSSVDGRSDELSGSQTLSTSSVPCGSESGFLARGHVIHNVLLLLRRCCDQLRCESEGSSVSCDVESAALRQRVDMLQEHITDAQWRLRIVTAPSSDSVCPHTEHQRVKRQRLRSKQSHDGMSRKDSDVSYNHSHTDNTVVSKMLGRPESLLNLCLIEGRITEAEEVVKV